MPRARALFPIALSATQAAQALRVPLRVVHEAINKGEITARRAPDGQRIRILVRSLEKWVESWPDAYRKKRSP
jgi:excisionase family DNA binding protein